MKTKTTDPQDESLTLVDKQNKVIGRIPRAEAHDKKDVNYRTIYVLVRNEVGDILIQKRSPTKDLYPDCWDLSVGGHVNYGDSYEDTAVREIEEELGIMISKADLTVIGDVIVNLPNSNEYFRVFEYTLNRTDKINATDEEISETDWMSIEEIKRTMKDETVNWYERPIQVISALY